MIGSQFPRWKDLPVEPVVPGGWDNRTFRLGRELLVRLPSAEGYRLQVPKEQAWLPRLAPGLPVPIPQPVGWGRPGEGYPWDWSVYRWIPGEPASSAPVVDQEPLARDLAAFLSALWGCPTTGAPGPGEHNFFRGGDLEVYDAETRGCLARPGTGVDTRAALGLWERALASRWSRPPVWVHGDMSASNVLVRDGRLAAVLDFGTSAVGDPACDLAIAWTFLDGAARTRFRDLLGLDAETWVRGQGWVLWKALLGLCAALDGEAASADLPRAQIGELLRS